MEKNEFLLTMVYCPLCGCALEYVVSEKALHKMQLVHKDPAGHTMEEVEMLGSACPNTGTYEAPVIELTKIESWAL